MYYNKLLSIILVLGIINTTFAESVVSYKASVDEIRSKGILALHLSLVPHSEVPVVPEHPNEIVIGETCPICRGTGKQSTDGIVQLECVHCNGDGVVDEGDPILGDEDPEPQPDKKKEGSLFSELSGQSSTDSSAGNVKTVVINDNWAAPEKKIETFYFNMGGHNYYYVQAPNVFYAPTNGKYYKPKNISWNNKSFKVCYGTFCQTYFLKKGLVAESAFQKAPSSQKPKTTSQYKSLFEDTDYSSPVDVIERALAQLNPKSNETFLDVGSGDGRVAIIAAMKYGCKSIGIESDEERVAEARMTAEKAGVADKVTFIVGDINTIDWPKADVGYVYLFDTNLGQVRNKLLGIKRFVSYSHQVPKLPMYVKGDLYIWDYNNAFAWWDGVAYKARPKRGCNCQMCNSVVASLNEQRSHLNQ